VRLVGLSLSGGGKSNFLADVAATGPGTNSGRRRARIAGDEVIRVTCDVDPEELGLGERDGLGGSSRCVALRIALSRDFSDLETGLVGLWWVIGRVLDVDVVVLDLSRVRRDVVDIVGWEWDPSRFGGFHLGCGIGPNEGPG
jgi:hypothetical protein